MLDLTRLCEILLDPDASESDLEEAQRMLAAYRGALLNPDPGSGLA